MMEKNVLVDSAALEGDMNYADRYVYVAPPITYPQDVYCANCGEWHQEVIPPGLKPDDEFESNDTCECGWYMVVVPDPKIDYTKPQEGDEDVW